MVLRKPTSFTAGRKVTLQDGTTYQPGATVPTAVAKACRNLSALLSRRILVPDARTSATKGKVGTPTPTDISPRMRQDL